MKIVVSSEASGLNAKASPIFGRCPVYVFVDTETMEVESVQNPAQNAAGGAGIQAAQFVVSKDVQAALAGNIGPNASNVLTAAGIDLYLVGDVTVEQAVKAFVAGELTTASGASLASHSGMGGGGAAPIKSGDEELATLVREVVELRKRLASIVTRIEALEKEN